MKIRPFKIYVRPGQVMPVYGLTAALVHVCADLTFEFISGTEQPDELKRDLIV